MIQGEYPLPRAMDEYWDDARIRKMLFGFFFGSAIFFLFVFFGLDMPVADMNEEMIMVQMFGWGSVCAIIGWAAA